LKEASSPRKKMVGKPHQHGGPLNPNIHLIKHVGILLGIYMHIYPLFKGLPMIGFVSESSCGFFSNLGSWDGKPVKADFSIYLGRTLSREFPGEARISNYTLED